LSNQGLLRSPLLGDSYIEWFAYKHAYVHIFACKAGAGHAEAMIVPYFVPS